MHLAENTHMFLFGRIERGFLQLACFAYGNHEMHLLAVLSRERRAICISGYVVHSDAPDASGRPISRIVIDDQRRVRTHMHSFLDVHPSITSPFGALLDPGCSN